MARKPAKRHAAGKKRPDTQPKFCGAWIKRRKKNCTRPAGWWTSHPGRGRCGWHGGKTASHTKKAQREELADAVVKFDLPASMDPLEALLAEITLTRAMVDYFTMRVQRLTEAKLQDSDGRYLLGWLHRERKLLVFEIRVAILSGIEERMIEVAEQDAAAFARALDGILADLGVADHPKLGKVVRKHLTLLRGGKAA